jgi:peptidoglycan-associated lipoprotein
MRIAHVVPSLLVLTAAFAVGCGSPKPPETSHDAAGQVAITSSHAPAAPHGDAVALSADLKKLCGIEDRQAAPRFDFDSALLSEGDRGELAQLAKCMTTGPLTGKNVELVGRADPRGEAEYNMTLGETRASAVQSYLAQLGVAAGRIVTTSRGALDAEGHDEASWATDRRVDLRLAGR